MKEPKRPIYYVPSPEIIFKAGQLIQDGLAQALYYFLYLTGSRINESTDFSLSKLYFLPEEIKIRMKTEKRRIEAFKERDVRIPRGKDALCYENEMWQYVHRYLSSIKDPYLKVFRRYGNMSMYLRRRINLTTDAKYKNVIGDWIQGKLTKPFHPHYLRHCRATHLKEYYKFDTLDLMQFFGWANAQMALRYSHSTYSFKRN